jgi:uncharacterized protein
MSQANVDVVTEMFASRARGDMDAYFSLFDPDADFTEPASLPYGGTRHGHSEMRDLKSEARSAWGRLQFELEEKFDAGDAVFATARVRAQATDTGKEVDQRVLYLIKLSNRKITSLELYLDTVPVCDALGTILLLPQGADK